MTLVPTLGFVFLYVCASHPVHHAQQAMTVDAEGDVTEAKMKQLLLGLKSDFPFCVWSYYGRVLHLRRLLRGWGGGIDFSLVVQGVGGGFSS